MVQNIYNILLMTDPRRTTSISLIYARPIKSDYFLGQLMKGMIGMVDLLTQKECGRPDYVHRRAQRPLLSHGITLDSDSNNLMRAL